MSSAADRARISPRRRSPSPFRLQHLFCCVSERKLRVAFLSSFTSFLVVFWAAELRRRLRVDSPAPSLAARRPRPPSFRRSEGPPRPLLPPRPSQDPQASRGLVRRGAGVPPSVAAAPRPAAATAALPVLGRAAAAAVARGGQRRQPATEPGEGASEALCGRCVGGRAREGARGRARGRGGAVELGRRRRGVRGSSPEGRGEGGQLEGGDGRVGVRRGLAVGDGREGVGGGGEGVRGSRRGHGPRRKGGIRAQSCLSHAAHVRPVEGRAGEQHVPAGGRRSERAGRGGGGEKGR